VEKSGAEKSLQARKFEPGFLSEFRDEKNTS